MNESNLSIFHSYSYIYIYIYIYIIYVQNLLSFSTDLPTSRMSAKILTKKELEKLINEGDKSVKFVQKKPKSNSSE